MITLTREQAEFVAQLLRDHIVPRERIRVCGPGTDAERLSLLEKRAAESDNSAAIVSEIERQLKSGVKKTRAQVGMVRKRSGWFYQWVDSQWH